MLDHNALQSASDLLYAQWMALGRIDHLPAACRPSTRAEGYAIQALLEQRSAAPLYGWKIAATSAVVNPALVPKTIDPIVSPTKRAN